LEKGNDTQKKREEIKFKSVEIRYRISPPPPIGRERGEVTLEKCRGSFKPP